MRSNAALQHVGIRRHLISYSTYATETPYDRCTAPSVDGCMRLAWCLRIKGRYLNFRSTRWQDTTCNGSHLDPRTPSDRRHDAIRRLAENETARPVRTGRAVCFPAAGRHASRGTLGVSDPPAPARAPSIVRPCHASNATRTRTSHPHRTARRAAARAPTAASAGSSAASAHTRRTSTPTRARPATHARRRRAQRRAAPDR